VALEVFQGPPDLVTILGLDREGFALGAQPPVSVGLDAET
jgi:hypothetical protein